MQGKRNENTIIFDRCSLTNCCKEKILDSVIFFSIIVSVMEKIVERGLLYDFYGPLLTGHQQAIYEANVYDNLSLSEIAEQENVSRQAVHDILKRCDKTLIEYEEKLQLIARFNRNRSRLKQLKEKLSSEDDKKLVDEIIDEL